MQLPPLKQYIFFYGLTAFLFLAITLVPVTVIAQLELLLAGGTGMETITKIVEFLPPHQGNAAYAAFDLRPQVLTYFRYEVRWQSAFKQPHSEMAGLPIRSFSVARRFWFSFI